MFCINATVIVFLMMIRAVIAGDMKEPAQKRAMDETGKLVVGVYYYPRYTGDDDQRKHGMRLDLKGPKIPKCGLYDSAGDYNAEWAKAFDAVTAYAAYSALTNVDTSCNNIIMVIRFNEWYEDSQIEATAGIVAHDSESGTCDTGGETCADHGYLCLDMLKEEIQKIKSYNCYNTEPCISLSVPEEIIPRCGRRIIHRRINIFYEMAGNN